MTVPPTAAPWVADARHGGVIRGGPVHKYTRGEGQAQIGLATGHDWMAEGEQTANAHLMAAAHELRTACEEWLKPLPYNPEEAQWSEPGDYELGLIFQAEWKRRIDLTMAALAKSRGEK